MKKRAPRHKWRYLGWISIDPKEPEVQCWQRELGDYLLRLVYSEGEYLWALVLPYDVPRKPIVCTGKLLASSPAQAQARVIPQVMADLATLRLRDHLMFSTNVLVLDLRRALGASEDEAADDG